jgi:hypothetical protein
MGRRFRVPAAVGALVVMAATAMCATACSALRPVSAQGPGDAVCAPVDADDSHVTIGTTFVSSTVGAEIIGVDLADGDNLEVIGWRTRPLEGTLIGAARGFDLRDVDHAVEAGTERYVEIGYRLVDPSRRGHAQAVRLAYRALDRDGLTGPTGVEVTIVPADDDCAAY